MTNKQDTMQLRRPNSNKGNPNPMTRRSLILSGSTVLAGVAAMGVANSGQAQSSPPAANHPNVAIIKRYYEAYGRGDLAAVRQIFAPNIVWHIPGHHPLAGPKRGPDEVFAFFEQLARANFKAEVIFLGGNDEYVVDYHRGYGALGDAKLDINWCLVFQMLNGRIVEAINFAGDQHAADAFFWSAYPLKPIPDRLAVARRNTK